MRAFGLALACFSLAACTTIPGDPCYPAGLMMQQNTSGPEIVAAADKCLAEGGNRAFGLGVRSYGRLRSTQYQQAIEDADAAIALQANYADAFYYRGYAEEELGNIEAARHDYEQAVALGLSPVLAIPARGRSRFLSNDFAGAYDDFTVWIENEPNNEAAYRSRGAAAAVLERFPQAIADFTKAIELNGNPKAHSGRAYIYYLTGRYAEAVADFKIALAPQPEGLKAAFLYQAMVRANDPDAKAELQRQSVGLDLRANPGVFVALYLDQVSIDEEVEIAIRTGQHKPKENESEAYFYAGMKELFAGNREKAKTWFQRVLGTGVIRFDEIRGARKELRAMGMSIPSPDPRAQPGS